MGFPELPTILTNADWQKQKGKVAKLFAGETGIGAQMDKLKAAAGKINIAKTNAAMAYKSEADVDAAIKECKAELAKTEPIRKEAYALRDQAKKIATEFKKNKLIPAASTAHVESIAKAADLYGVTVKSYDPSADFTKAKERLKSNAALQTKILTEGLAKCTTAIAGLKGGKATPDDYEKKALQLIRGYAASVAKSSELKSIQAEWKALSSVPKDKLKDPAGVAKHLTALEALVKKTTPLVS